MNSEIKNIYNRKVFEFRAKVREHEKLIAQNKMKMETLIDFTNFCEKVQNMLQEYYALFDGIHNNMDRVGLEETLNKEFEYLNLLRGFNDLLSHYHDVIGFVEPIIIQKEWQNIVTIVNYQYRKKDLEKQLETMAWKYFNIRKYSGHKYESKEAKLTKENIKFNRLLNRYRRLDKKNLSKVQMANILIEERGNATERLDDDYSHDYQNFQKTKKNIELMGRQALDSFQELFDIAQVDVNDSTSNLKIEDSNRSNMNKKAASEKRLLGTDYNYYINLSLENKIKYLKLKLVNLEGKKGKKQYIKSVDKSISSKHVAEYKSYLALLKELERQELAQITTESQVKVANNEIYFVEDLEKNLDTHLIQVTMEEDEKERFKEETFENQKRIIFYKIQFLKSLNQSSPEVQKKIDSLHMKLKKIEEDETNANKLYAQTFSQSFKLPEEMHDFYVNVMVYFDKFQLSKKYGDSEKKYVFQDILSKLNTYKEKFREKSLDFHFDVFLKEQTKKMREGLASLPVVKKMVSKIKGVHQAKNQENLRLEVKKIAVSTAILLGTMFVSVSSSSNLSKSQESEILTESTMETKTDTEYYASNTREMSIDSLETDDFENAIDVKEEKQFDLVVEQVNAVVSPAESKKESSSNVSTVLVENEAKNETEETYNFANEENDFSFGDHFTVKEDANVYMTYEDALNQVNPLEMHFEADSMREVAGASYIYNGEIVFVSEADPDYEAKIVALDQMGAVRNNDVVLAMNENGIGPGFEGFYNIEDIQFEEKGVSR